MKQFEIDEVMKEHYRTARITIAWLCFLLPILSVVFGLIGVAQGYNLNGWYCSISDTYYANSTAIMTGILAISAFYFATYKGYDIRDRIVNITSAICSAGIALFPVKGVGGLIQLPVAGPWIHYTFALVLYASFFVNCTWLFRLGKSDTVTKKKRNKVYLICGILIAAVCAALSICVLSGLSKTHPICILICEIVGQTSYAAAWFVKSGAILSDN